MKTKLSKRILSVVLAALMVVTSVPLMAISALADVSTSDLNLTALDSYARNLYDEMTAFEDKLHEDVVYADVTDAYAKYAAAQKAFDAYVYGTGTSDSVEAAATALREAADQMAVYTGTVTGNAVPAFADSSVDAMQTYAGTAYKNVLQASTASEISEGGSVGGVMHNVHYAADAVLLYDGSGDDIILPVLMSANTAANGDTWSGLSQKSRWIWSAYPTESASSNLDNADFYLEQRWRSANTNNADWITNWTADTSNPQKSMAEYNYATGAVNTITNATAGYCTSDEIPKNSRRLSGFSYVYTEGAPLYMANILKYKGTPTDWGQEYTISWAVTTGGSDNANGSNVQATAPIKVINYTTLANAVRTNYNFVKTLDLKDYSEGGLTAYFEAIKAAASYDPNTAFNKGASDPYATCITEMQNLAKAAENAVEDIQNDEEWGMNIKNTTQYETLRGVMNKLMSTYNKGVNSGYTDESWEGFVALWTEAQAVMNDVVANGYTQTDAALSIANRLSAYKLETNVTKVNTATLELIIDTYEGWTNIFTNETTAALAELITEIKTTVWTPTETTLEDGTVIKEEQYKNDAQKLNDEGRNQNIVDEYAFQLTAAIRALRINPDAVVATGVGRYSVNSAMALENNVKDRQDDFGNYADFQTALNAATTYKDGLANLSLQFSVDTDRKGNLVVTTDYTEVYNNYIAVAREVVEKYEALAAALIKIENGQIMKTVGTETIALEYHRNSNGYNHYVNFTYPTSVILFKTTHDDAKFTYGKANLEWKINIDNNTGKDMNALDSITINATRASGQINEKTWALAQNAYPTGLSDNEKQSVAAQLSYTVTNADGTNSTFELSNFKFANQYNNRKTMLAIDDSANNITDRNADLTSILATTNGSGTRQQYGVIPIQPLNSGDASITLSSDMSVTVPGTIKQELSADTRPTVGYYTLAGNYFGATYQWHTQPSGFQYCGWDHLSTVPNGDYAGQEMYSSVMVIDISYLVDLIKECNKLTTNSENFTAESWAKFSAALSEANKEIPYTDNTSADAVRKTVQNRYDNLWKAFNELEIPLTFVAKNADGTDKTTVVNVLRNYYLNDDLNASEYGVTTEYSKALRVATETVATYYSDDLATRYDLAGWSPEVDTKAKVTTKTTYEAKYDESLNLADFTQYNAAKEALAAALSTATPVYSVDALNAVKADVESMTYFTMTPEEQGTVVATSQAAVDAETARLTALKDNLTPAQVSQEDAELLVAAKQATMDKDAYDVSISIEYSTEVVIDGVAYEGLVYDTYDKLNKVVTDALNSASKKIYNIELNGTVVGTAEYGEVVVVDSEGNVHKNTDIDTSYPELTNVAWSYSYAAPSRNNEFTAAKYMLTATSLGFIVKGDTKLTTAAAKSDGIGYVVKFVTNDGRVFDVQYTTDGTVKMPVAPSYAFYTFTGYDNGATANSTITVTADTTIVANYAPQAADTFVIDYFENWETWSGQSQTEQYVKNYNELVELSNPDAYCWVTSDLDANSGISIHKIVKFGTDYKFYACEAFEFAPDENEHYYGITAITEDEYRMLIEESTTETGELNEDWYDFIVDTNGNEILAVIDDYYGTKRIPDPEASVNAVEDVFEIYNASGAPEKFTMIGSAAVPADCKLIEVGFLFTTDRTATMKLENVGKNGLARMKASRLLADNQFAINVKTSTDRTFKYAAYAIVEMPDGTLNTIYTTAIDGATNF